MFASSYTCLVAQPRGHIKLLIVITIHSASQSGRSCSYAGTSTAVLLTLHWHQLLQLQKSSLSLVHRPQFTGSGGDCLLHATEQMSMYIRVKRQKTTVFLQVEPTDTVLEVKQSLQALIEKPPDKVQLHKQSANGSYEQLEDSKKLADLKVENDDVVAMCYMQEDGSGFEAIKISTPGEDAAANGEPGVKQEA